MAAAACPRSTRKVHIIYYTGPQIPWACSKMNHPLCLDLALGLFDPSNDWRRRAMAREASQRCRPSRGKCSVALGPADVPEGGRSGSFSKEKLEKLMHPPPAGSLGWMRFLNFRDRVLERAISSAGPVSALVVAPQGARIAAAASSSLFVAGYARARKQASRFCKLRELRSCVCCMRVWVEPWLPCIVPSGLLWQAMAFQGLVAGDLLLHHSGQAFACAGRHLRQRNSTAVRQRATSVSSRQCRYCCGKSGDNDHNDWCFGCMDREWGGGSVMHLGPAVLTKCDGARNACICIHTMEPFKSMMKNNVDVG